MPTRSTTPCTNLRPSAYCRIFTSMPSSRRITRSSGLAASRRRLNFARISSTLGTTSGPTPSMTNSACPSSSVISAVSRSSTAFWAGRLHDVEHRARGCPGRGPRRPARPRRGAAARAMLVAALRGVDERLHLAEEVAAHPRHRGELRAVGDLVQADPEPEVARVGAELALHLDDVRRDQQQLARVGGEDLVLPEHPPGQVRQDRAGLHAGDPASRSRRRTARLLARRSAGRPAASMTCGGRRC